MTKTTYKVTNLNDGSDFLQHDAESLDVAYKMGAEMAKASAEANGITTAEAAKHIVVTSVTTENISLADAMAL